MRVLLVNPPPYAIVEPVYDRPAYPRTSLACLAAYLREHGVDVHVLDCKYDRLGFDEALEHIERLAPQVVGFTGLTNEVLQAARLAALVKELDPSIVTVMGDVHMSALPEQTLRETPAFDYGVVGEGEETLRELVEQLAAGGDEPITAKGVAYLAGDTYVFNGSRDNLDVSALPMPAWDLFRPAEHYILQTSRGCPFHCSFCMNPAGRVVRARTPAQVLDELELLLELGAAESVYFGDEIFTVKRERVATLCAGMIERGLHRRLKWSCQTHVNTVDVGLAHLMRAAGCDWVGLGIETADEDKMTRMGKGINRERVMRAVSAMRSAGLRFHGFFILGQPNETYESARATIDFAVEMNPDGIVFGIMVPYPGTRVHALAERDAGGYVNLSSNWNDYNKQIGHAVEFTGIERRRLERLQMLGYLRVFVQNGRTLELLRMVPRFTTLALHMVLKQLGFGPERVHARPVSPPPRQSPRGSPRSLSRRSSRRPPQTPSRPAARGVSPRSPKVRLNVLGSG